MHENIFDRGGSSKPIDNLRIFVQNLVRSYDRMTYKFLYKTHPTHKDLFYYDPMWDRRIEIYLYDRTPMGEYSTSRDRTKQV